MLMPHRHILAKRPVSLPTTFGSRRGWYPADGLSFANGAAVDACADAFGNGNALSQASGTLQPLYRANGGPNGRPALEFDGTDDNLSNASGVIDAQPYTVLCVCKGDVAANRVPWSLNTNAFLYSFTSTTGKLNAGSDVTFNCVVTNWNIFGVVLNGASSFINVNGVVTTGNAGTGHSPRLSMGCYGNASGFYWDGMVAELITYSAAFDQSDVQRLVRYLSQKYAIQVV